MQAFARINSYCYRGLEVTQVSELGGLAHVDRVGRDLEPHLLRQLGLG